MASTRKRKFLENLSPEQKFFIAQILKRRFRVVIRLVIYNIPWLQEADEKQEIGENINKNIRKIIWKKDKKSLLSLKEKCLLKKPSNLRTPEEIELLYHSIGGIKCFRDYPEDVKEKLSAITYFIYVEPNHEIIKQGHRGKSLYFIISGEVKVTRSFYNDVLNETEIEEIAVFGSGEMFGEISFLYNELRRTTSTAVTPCELLTLSREDFNVVLKESVQKEWDRIRSALSRFTYFRTWSERWIRECCVLSKIVTFEADETIVGDRLGPTDYVFFILEGKCRLIEDLYIIKHHKRGIANYKLAERPDIQQKDKKPLTTIEKILKMKNFLQQSSITTMEKYLLDIFEKTAAESQASSASETKKPLAGLSDADVEMNFQTLRALKQSAPLFTVPTDIGLSYSNKDQARTYFMQVCLFHELSCFSLGENLKNRRVVAITPVKALKIPRYWLFQKNTGNIWSLLKQFLDHRLPSTNQLFQQFINDRKWNKHCEEMQNRIIRDRRACHTNKLSNVPYYIRVHEFIANR